jgi:hypothetical protein
VTSLSLDSFSSFEVEVFFVCIRGCGVAHVRRGMQMEFEE